MHRALVWWLGSQEDTQFSSAWLSMARHGTARLSMVQNGMAQHRSTRLSTAWHSSAQLLLTRPARPPPQHQQPGTSHGCAAGASKERVGTMLRLVPREPMRIGLPMGSRDVCRHSQHPQPAPGPFSHKRPFTSSNFCSLPLKGDQNAPRGSLNTAACLHVLREVSQPGHHAGRQRAPLQTQRGLDTQRGSDTEGPWSCCTPQRAALTNRGHRPASPGRKMVTATTRQHGKLS